MACLLVACRRHNCKETGVTGLILYFGLALLLLAFLDWFPPTSLVVKPLVQALFSMSGGLLVGAWRYLVIFAKSLIADHILIFRHLTHRRIDLDPRERMEYENAKRR